MRTLIVILFGALALLHQDFWWWDDRTLLFGFLPIGLGYHALFSVLAGCLWWLAVTKAWPNERQLLNGLADRDEE